MPRSFKPIIPPKLDVEAMLEELQKGMDQFAPIMIHDMERLTNYWKGERPKFSPVRRMHPRQEIRLSIRVSGSELAKNKWVWMDEGTRPHKIRAKNKPALAFRTGYKAGSKANSLLTAWATRASGPLRRPREVNHPGTKARRWTELLVDKHSKTFQRYMELSMQKAARASGHEYKR